MSAHEMTQVRVCEAAGCTEEADVGSWCFFHARTAAPEAPPLETNGNGVTHVVPAGTAAVPARPKTKPWTPEEAIPAIQAFHRDHGRAPGFEDLNTKNGLPTAGVLTRLFGGIPHAVRAAGLEPLSARGSRKPGPAAAPRTPPAGRPVSHPKPAEAKGAGRASTTPGAARNDPEPPGTSGSLSELAQRVDALHADYEQKREAALEASRAHDQALGALVAAATLLYLEQAS